MGREAVVQLIDNSLTEANGPPGIPPVALYASPTLLPGEALRRKQTLTSENTSSTMVSGMVCVLG